MAYNYTAYVSVKTYQDGRYANFTDAPTVTAIDGVAESVIVSPSPSIVNLAVGLYEVKLAGYADLTDVLFKVEAAAADQATIGDALTLHTEVEQVVDGRVDVLTSSRIATDAASLDNLNATISSRATPADVDVTVTISESAVVAN
jgi:hypothetical protein